jgi:membrane-associated phospholipid phosphatase
MVRMNAVQKWALAFALTAVAVVVSYLWLDRPIALIAHDQLRRYHIFEELTRIPELITPLAMVIFIALGFRALSDRPLSRLDTVVVLAGASLAVATVVKDQLKHVFGRTWPETWVRNNPSFIRDGAYGFNPFQGGPGYASFPSGHTTAVCAVMTVLWICYPKFRLLYALCVAAVAIGLVGANYHFLSDVIAGAFLGVSIGWLTVSIWEHGPRRLHAPQPVPDDPPQPVRQADPVSPPAA